MDFAAFVENKETSTKVVGRGVEILGSAERLGGNGSKINSNRSPSTSYFIRLANCGLEIISSR